MQKKDKFVVMMVGKTHTGKSTFGNKLAKKIPKTVVLETDPITIFLRNNWPDLQLGEKKSAYSKKLVSPIRLKIFKDLFGTALAQSFNIILTNANLRLFTRKDLLEMVKKYKEYKIIIVFLNLSEKKLLLRINSSNRTKDVLLESDNFLDALEKQNKVIENPDKKEADYFFEIKDENGFSSVMEKIISIVNDK